MNKLIFFVLSAFIGLALQGCGKKETVDVSVNNSEKKELVVANQFVTKYACMSSKETMQPKLLDIEYKRGSAKSVTVNGRVYTFELERKEDGTSGKCLMKWFRASPSAVLGLISNKEETCDENFLFMAIDAENKWDGGCVLESSIK